MTTPTKPFPDRYPRNVDFIPLLTLQNTLQPNLEMFRFQGIVSVSAEKARRIVDLKNKEANLKIMTVRGNRPHTLIDYPLTGKLDTSLPTTTGEAIIENVVKLTGQPELIPELVIKERGIKIKPTKSLEEIKAVQGMENLYQHETACGYHPKLVSSVLGVRFFKPFLTMRAELINKKILKPWDVDLRRMRSILPTDWLVGDDKGYNYFMQTGALQPTLEALCEGKFHQDTAIFQGRVDGIPVSNRIYLLHKRDELIPI
jgi:hypothetical protein